MPELVKMYIRNVAIGFGVAAIFVALLLWFDLRGAGALDQLIGSALRRRLVRRPSGGTKANLRTLPTKATCRCRRWHRRRI